MDRDKLLALVEKWRREAADEKRESDGYAYVCDSIGSATRFARHEQSLKHAAELEAALTEDTFHE